MRLQILCSTVLNELHMWFATVKGLISNHCFNWINNWPSAISFGKLFHDLIEISARKYFPEICARGNTMGIDNDPSFTRIKYCNYYHQQPESWQLQLHVVTLPKLQHPGNEKLVEKLTLKPEACTKEEKEKIKKQYLILHCAIMLSRGTDKGNIQIPGAYIFSWRTRLKVAEQLRELSSLFFNSSHYILHCSMYISPNLYQTSKKSTFCFHVLLFVALSKWLKKKKNPIRMKYLV